MARGKAPAIRICTRSDHPSRRHGHYGYGGRYWCSDFGSPLLGEANMGHVERGWIVIFEKPPTPPTATEASTSVEVTGRRPMAEVGGIRIASAGRACDNDRCSVLVYNAEGPRVAGSPPRGCPSCGHDGFDVRFGIGLDELTAQPSPTGDGE